MTTGSTNMYNGQSRPLSGVDEPQPGTLLRNDRNQQSNTLFNMQITDQQPASARVEEMYQISPQMKAKAQGLLKHNARSRDSSYSSLDLAAGQTTFYGRYRQAKLVASSANFIRQCEQKKAYRGLDSKIRFSNVGMTSKTGVIRGGIQSLNTSINRLRESDIPLLRKSSYMVK